MKNNNFKENFIPAIVLVCICLVVSLALAATYNVSNPTIIANQQKSADEARMEVLPDGDSFTEYDGKLVNGVDDCYIADNKAGMAVTAEYKGFGGAVKVMIGIDANGRNHWCEGNGTFRNSGSWYESCRSWISETVSGRFGSNGWSY